MKDNSRKKDSEILRLAATLLEVLENSRFNNSQVIRTLDLCAEAYELELDGELSVKEHAISEILGHSRGIKLPDKNSLYEVLHQLFETLERQDFNLEDRFRAVSIALNTAWGYSSCLHADVVSWTLKRIEERANREIEKLRQVIPVFLKKASETILVPLNSADHMFLRDALQKAQIDENTDIDKVIYPLAYVLERLTTTLKEQPEYSDFAEFEQLAILRMALFAKVVLHKWIHASKSEDKEKFWWGNIGQSRCDSEKSLMDIFRIGVYAGTVDTVSDLPTDWMSDYFNKEGQRVRRGQRKMDAPPELIKDVQEAAIRLKSKDPGKWNNPNKITTEIYNSKQFHEIFSTRGTMQGTVYNWVKEVVPPKSRK